MVLLCEEPTGDISDGSNESDESNGSDGSNGSVVCAAEAVFVLFLASCWWLTRTSLESVSISSLIVSAYSLSKRKPILFYR